MNAERKIVVIGLGLLPIYAAFLTTIWHSNPAITMENGLMENLQAVSLAIACLALIPSIYCQGSRIPRFNCWILFLMFAGLFLREVDVEELVVSPLLVSLGSGTGRNVMLGMACCLTAVYFFRNVDKLFPSMIRSVVTGPSLLWLAGCSLYAASLPFDKGMLPVTAEHKDFCEEIVECGATFMFLACAVCTSVTNYLNPFIAKRDQDGVDRHDSDTLAGEHRRVA